MKKSLILLTLLVTAIAAPNAAARDILAYQTTTPMLYRYAACALATEEATQEAQIEKCRQFREQIEEEAGAVLLRFNAQERRPAKLNLVRGLDQIDKDAIGARAQRKTVPVPIIAYLKCMGESVMETEDYQKGVAVDYIAIEEQCLEKHILSVTYVSTDQELERIKILYRRFARTGRYISKSTLGEGIARTGDTASGRSSGRPLSNSRGAPPVVVMEQGFLNLSHLPSDEKTNDQP